jgi:hypothetical protein
MSDIVKHRRKLNAEQITVLELLYKFRFGSNDLIAQFFGKKDRSFVFKRLSILQELDLVGKRFESSYRLRGRPAAYYLLPEGARTIQKYREEGDTDEVNIKAIYKDATVSEKFIDHCFAVFALYMMLGEKYGDDLDFFSKTDQAASFDNLPKPQPDGYLTFQEDDSAKHYFLDILDDDAHLLVDASKKIKRYFDYKQSGNWVLVADEPFPAIIFICNSEAACKKVQKRCDSAIKKAWIRDIEFRVFAKEAVSLD